MQFASVHVPSCMQRSRSNGRIVGWGRTPRRRRRTDLVRGENWPGTLSGRTRITARRIGAVQLGSNSQFPRGSPERGFCRAAFLNPFAVPSRFQKMVSPPGCWQSPFRVGRIATVSAADSRCSALSSGRDHRFHSFSGGQRLKTGVYYPFFGD